MKEINGTVTLAYVEEDNKQRVIFRVIPLCTREGSVFHGGAEDFPDEGSLRIVPDKREQSTFKDRMREIGGLCAVYLLNDGGKELVKVRQNRNYAPDQGEKNKLAIYSDVICEFAEDGCFEVLEQNADFSLALTEKILLLKNKLLYGPVLREEAAGADIASLRPFGNDSFLLHCIETPLLGKRQIYWNPDAVLNWRQRRNALRRKERTSEENAAMPEAKAAQEQTAAQSLAEAAAPKPEAPLKPETAAKPEAAAKHPRTKADPEQRKAPASKAALDKSAAEQTPTDQPSEESKLAQEAKPAIAAQEPKPVQPAAKPAQREQEGKLPIGTKLTILDAELSFDQHLSRLEQPLSESANRLTGEAVEEDEPTQATPYFSGTPLVRSAKPITRTALKPESVHHVVERQMLRRGDAVGEGGDYRLMENPIDSLRTCLDYIWQSADMRTQAMDMLCGNESFMHDMLQLFRRQCLNIQATAAAQEQLSEIEAERLSLLMQLEAAKTNEKKYREEALKTLTQKLRGESEKLKNEVRELEGTKAKLKQALAVMSRDTADQVRDYMSRNIECLSGVGEDRLLISPVVGRHYSAQEMNERLRTHMNECGYSFTEDDMTSLLVYFSVNDALCLLGPTEDDAARFAQAMLESFGLQSVAGSVLPNAYVEVVSLLPEDGQRTPTVTVQSLGTESMSIYGHKTIFLAGERNLGEYGFELPFTCPVIIVPPISRRSFASNEEWSASEPASISSFAEIRADAQPMQDEAAKWFDQLKGGLENTELSFPAPTFADIRRFIEVAAQRVRGGFLAAADSAVCHWIVPTLLLRRADVGKLGAVFAGLPKTLERLNIQ